MFGNLDRSSLAPKKGFPVPRLSIQDSETQSQRCYGPDSKTPAGATPFTPGSAATYLYTDAFFQLGDMKFKPHRRKVHMDTFQSPALRQCMGIGASNLWPTCIFIRSGPRIGDRIRKAYIYSLILFKGLDPQAGRSVALPL